MDEEQMARLMCDALAQNGVYIDDDNLAWVVVDGFIDMRSAARDVLNGLRRSAALDELGKLDGELLEAGGE
jgi:hypothetical protein